MNNDLKNESNTSEQEIALNALKNEMVWDEESQSWIDKRLLDFNVVPTFTIDLKGNEDYSFLKKYGIKKGLKGKVTLKGDKNQFIKDYLLSALLSNSKIKEQNTKNLKLRNTLKQQKEKSRQSVLAAKKNNVVDRLGLTEFLYNDYLNYKKQHPQASINDFKLYKKKEHLDAQSTRDLALKAGAGIVGGTAAAAVLPTVAGSGFSSFVLKQIPGMILSNAGLQGLDKIAGNHYIEKNGLRILVDKDGVPIENSKHWANNWIARGAVDAASFATGGAGSSFFNGIGKKALIEEAANTALGQMIFKGTDKYIENPYLKNIVALGGNALTGRLVGNIVNTGIKTTFTNGILNAFKSENHYIPELIGNVVNAGILTGAETANDKLAEINPELARVISPMLFQLANYTGSKLLHSYSPSKLNQNVLVDKGLEGIYNRTRVFGMATSGGDVSLGMKPTVSRLMKGVDVNGNKVSRTDALKYIVTGDKNNLKGMTGYFATMKQDRSLNGDDRFSTTIEDYNANLPTITEINTGAIRLAAPSYDGTYKDPIHINGGYVIGNRSMFKGANPEITKYGENFARWADTPVIVSNPEIMAQIKNITLNGKFLMAIANPHKDIAAEGYNPKFNGKKDLFNTVGIRELLYEMPDGKIYTIPMDNMKHSLNEITERYNDKDNKESPSLKDKLKYELKKGALDERTSSIILDKPHVYGNDTEIAAVTAQINTQLPKLNEMRMILEMQNLYNSPEYILIVNRIKELEETKHFFQNLQTLSNKRKTAKKSKFDIHKTVKFRGKVSKNTTLEQENTEQEMLNLRELAIQTNNNYEASILYANYLKKVPLSKEVLLRNKNVQVLNSDGSINEEATLEKAKLLYESFEYQTAVKSASTRSVNNAIKSIKFIDPLEYDKLTTLIVDMLWGDPKSGKRKVPNNKQLNDLIEGLSIKEKGTIKRLIKHKWERKNKEYNLILIIKKDKSIYKNNSRSGKFNNHGKKIMKDILEIYPDLIIPSYIWELFPKQLQTELVIRHYKRQ